MTTLLTVVMVVFGVWAYFRLPVNSLPTVDLPVIQVTAYYPGASPATMASAVATPLENEFIQINGLQGMYSDNKEGMSTINLTFSLKRNVDLVAPDVQAAIARAVNNLPKDLPSPPTYQKFNPSDMPVYFIVICSDTMPHGELYDYASHVVQRKMSMIEGVSKVMVYGSKRAVRVQFSPDKLANYQIGVDELAMALKAGTVNIPGGSLNGAQKTFTIEPQGQMRTAREYDELIIAYRQNAPVRLKDVANVVDSLANDLVDIRMGFAGKKEYDKCVVMPIYRVSGANTVAVADRIVKALEEAKKDLPGSVNIETLFNGAKPIRESLEDVQVTVLIALVLVVLVIFGFLGRVRETIVPSIVLPVTLLGTMLLMLASKFNLDTLSLMGIVLAVTFLVDDAIVVLENTVRHLEEGKKPIPAAVLSMKEITFTLISTSAALVIVFAPLVFMSGVVGKNLSEVALTVIYAIIVSTFLALTLSPMMCARIIKHHKDPNALQKRIAGAIAGMVRTYGRALTWQLHHKWMAVVMWVVCIVGTLALYFIPGALPKDFLPPGDSSFIMGAMLMPQGASTEQMRTYQTKIAAVVRQDPNVFECGNVTGIMPGADQSMGFVFIRLKPPKERVKDHEVKRFFGLVKTTRRPTIDELAQRFIGKFFMIPDGVCFVRPMPVVKISSGAESTAMGSDYAYMVMGLNRDAVYETAQKLQQEIQANVPFVFNLQSTVKLNMPRLNIEIDRDRASSLGISALSIESSLALAYAQGYVAQFTTDQDQYQVIPEVEKGHRRSPEDLSLLYLRSQISGALVPMKSIVRLVENAGPQSVPRAQQHESATISFSKPPGLPLEMVVSAIDKIASRVLPPGVQGRFVGDAFEFNKSIASLGVLILIAVFLKYIVLGILYESYIHPFTILTTLPVAVFGGFLTLFAFGRELSLYGYIGVFVLIGLITKNGILMVDFAEQRKREGKNSYDAIYDACLVRFRPILMTGLCAIFGAMPIALGYGADASSRIPLGLVVVGGMVFAQLITLFVTPGIYLYMEWIQERFFKPRTDLE